MKLSTFIYCFGLSLMINVNETFGQRKNSEVYLQRAEAIYKDVWKYYRVPGKNGLFTENFPSAQKDTLTYMQGGGVKEKKVSFLWPFSGMFSATNVLLKIPERKQKYIPYLDTVFTGIKKYQDFSRQPAGYQAYPLMFEKADRYYDDNGLVGIDYMEAYFNTKNPAYLNGAKSVFKFILSGWNDQLGGGVNWLEGHNDQKPACSNGSDLLVALKIYLATKDVYYLNWSKKFYNWMYQNLRDSTTGIYSNDKKLNGNVNRTFYTYNSGFMLEAAVLMYQFTHDKKYLVQAQQLAEATFIHFNKVPHNDKLNMKIDLPWFVTVLFRGYEALYKQDHNYKYLSAIEKDLNYAWQTSRDKFGLVTHSWTPNAEELQKPKWLLDEGCITELYARLSMLQKERNN